MKTIVFIVALCLVSAYAVELTEEQKQMIRPHELACMSEVGVTDAELDEARANGVDNLSDKIKCFTACMLKRIGFMTEDGKFDEDMSRGMLADHVPEDILNTAMDECRNEAGDNDCETAGKLVLCFMKHKAAI